MATENFTLLSSATSSNVFCISMNEGVSDALPVIHPMKLHASQAGSGGGKKESPMEKKVKGEDTADNKNSPASTESHDEVKKPANKSITDPDTDLTGDTGNLNKGQTDLGASGTGAENL